MKKGIIKRILGRTATCIGTFLLAIIILLYGVMAVVCRGPSHAARDLFVNTMMETSALKFLPRLYLSKAKVNEIVALNTVAANQDVTDTAAIDFEKNTAEDFDINAVKIEDVKGNTYVGKMLTVNDPSRIFVKTLQNFDMYGNGEYLADMVKNTGSVAGINAGGFFDPKGVGNGGMPIGAVIHEGVLVSNQGGPHSTIIGFDREYKLVIGDMTGKEAIDRGIMEGVAFGPPLIISGERVAITGTGGGLNPRTAIGQKADGSVLLLAVDGRQPHSLGATYKDIADIMEKFGAVNAANLDGGSSTMLIYNGEMQNSLSIIGTRRIPTAFLVSAPKK